MMTGFRGTFVISWSQTEVDGLKAAPQQILDVGTAWAWHGELVRVDGPNTVLRLGHANDEMNRRRQAARMVRKLVGAARSNTQNLSEIEIDDAPLPDSSFVVTDGAQSYTITLIEVGNGAPPLLMFLDDIPPRDTEMWVVHHSLRHTGTNATGPESGGVICFTPGTAIETPDGPRAVETLHEGDYVQTRDGGAQEIQWIGSRRMSGARLFAMPYLRPIRIHASALGDDRPDAELLVSPEHRLLIRGEVAQALFNTPEVLVAARDLVNHGSITVDTALREVTYYHVLLPQHHVLWANGIETESFHPASTALSTLAAEDRARLLALHPGLEEAPDRYGRFARRSLSRSEAAILAHEAA